MKIKKAFEKIEDKTLGICEICDDEIDSERLKLRPVSGDPVVIEDDVLIGANAVVLAGVKVGKGAVVAAGSIGVKDVEPNTVVAGVPAKLLKKVDDKTKAKTRLMDELRKL